MPSAVVPMVAALFCCSVGPYSGSIGFGSDDRRNMPGLADCDRMYAQSASGRRSSQRTAPPDSRSSRMQSSARNDWCLLAALRRYPSVVPHAATYSIRASRDNEFRYLSNLSMSVIYPQVKLKSIPTGHLPASKLLFECRMDKYEIRRQNLQALLHSHCGGRAATLADLLGRSPSYVSRMLYPEGKEGKKRIGEDLRDVIEDAFSLKRGSLDEQGAGQEDLAERPNAESPGEAGSPIPQIATNEPPPAPPETTLERLDSDEKSILELYRRATSDGKIMIRRTAIAVPKADD